MKILLLVSEQVQKPDESDWQRQTQCSYIWLVTFCILKPLPLYSLVSWNNFIHFLHFFLLSNTSPKGEEAETGHFIRWVHSAVTQRTGASDDEITLFTYLLVILVAATAPTTWWEWARGYGKSRYSVRSCAGTAHRDISTMWAHLISQWRSGLPAESQNHSSGFHQGIRTYSADKILPKQSHDSDPRERCDPVPRKLLAQGAAKSFVRPLIFISFSVSVSSETSHINKKRSWRPLFGNCVIYS